MTPSIKRFIQIVIALAAINLAANLIVILFVQSESIRLVFTDVTFPLGNLLTACILFIAAARWRSISTRAFYAWLILGVAHLFYTTGDIIWAIFEVGLNQSPYPSPADLFYIVYGPVFLIGILLFPADRLRRVDKIKSILDISIITLTSLMGLWFFLLGPIVASNMGEAPHSYLLDLFYPTSDLLLLWAVLAVLYRRGNTQNQISMLILAVSISLTIVTDSIYSYQSIQDLYIGGGFLDLGWLTAYFITLLAGVWELLRPIPREGTPQSSDQRQSMTWVNYLPYLWIIAAFLMLIYYHPQNQPVGFSMLPIGVSIVVMIVLIRQVITLEENRILTESLQRSLFHDREQGRQLQLANLDLENEIKIRKHIEVQLRHDAFHDSLTGLPNRTFFLDRLTRSIEYARHHPAFRFSVMLLDLDQFKAVNDSRGHPMGDRLLVAFTMHMTDFLRRTDTIARLGGDEFIFLIEHNDNQDRTTRVANRILEVLNKPFKIEDDEIYITASIGIVMYDPSYHNSMDIIRDVDIALYQAKAKGKARYHIFHPDLRTQVMTRQELVSQLRCSLERNEHELYFQPIISLRTNRITGFEALLRWRHPQRGLISPVEFIPIAEEMGILHEIGKWVLIQACTQIRTWQTQYQIDPPLTVSVNVSSSQISKPDFAEQVIRILQMTGLPGTCLNLEITESIYLNITQETIQLFNQLKSWGIKIHIDDFGIGYSSLSYLQHFPANTIKIDRTFTSRISSQNHAGIVQTIIAMAHELGMETIAEGVETEGQVKCLKEYGCDFAQGFLWFEPLEPDAAEEILKSNICVSPRSF